MKIHFLILSAVGVLSVLLTQSARAASYQDVDGINQLMNGGTGGGVSSYTGTFNIISGDGNLGDGIADGVGDEWGYQPASETITSGSILFIFDNPGFGRKTVSVTLSGEDFITPNTTLSLGTVVFGDLISGQAFLELDSTGIATYTINRTSGQFTLLGAELYVESGPRAIIPGVPDSGATATLFGLSILGLGFVARKLKGGLA